MAEREVAVDGAAVVGTFIARTEEDSVGATIVIGAESSLTTARSSGLVSRPSTSPAAEIHHQRSTSCQSRSGIAIVEGCAEPKRLYLDLTRSIASTREVGWQFSDVMRPLKGLIGSHRIRKTADSTIVNEATKPALRDVGRAPEVGAGAERHSALERLLRWTAGGLAVAALLASAALLLKDAAPELSAVLKFVVALAPRAWALLDHAPLSAMPLLLAGVSYIALQGLLRPPPIELMKRLLLGSAFLLWGIVQLMPPGVVATDLGDLVIGLFVFDLGIIVQAELREEQE